MILNISLIYLYGLSLIHRVIAYFVPFLTGRAACSDSGSGLPSGVKSQNSTASNTKSLLLVKAILQAQDKTYLLYVVLP